MTTPTSNDWHFIGKHSVRFEPPDIVFFQPDGDMSLEENTQLMQFVASLPKPERGFFGLLDVSKGGRQDPAAMKSPEAKAHVALHRAVVYFNASFYHRTVIGVFQRVARLLKLPGSDVRIMIFETEAEARKWIMEERKK